MFLGELRESSAATAAQWSQLREQVMSVMEYSRQDCLRERESLRKELESRLTATEEVRLQIAHICTVTSTRIPYTLIHYV